MALNTLRPIRPKPLIATLIAMGSSPYLIKLFLSFVFCIVRLKQGRSIFDLSSKSAIPPAARHFLL
jgi:hypothetical protein